MHYGRTIVEIVAAEAILVTAIMVVPFGIIASVTPEVSGLFATSITGVLGFVLYTRHTSRVQRTNSRQFDAQTQSNSA